MHCSPEAFVLGNVLINFLDFLLIHIFIFRSRKYQSAPQVMLLSILSGFIGILFVHLAGSVYLNIPGRSWSGILFLGGVSMSLYLMLVFHYVAWIFGMSEAAMRIRLLNEIDLRPNGRATLEDIYQTYNGNTILEVRLKRLVSAGHLTYDDQFYHLKGKILLLQALVSGWFRCFLGLPKK